MKVNAKSITKRSLFNLYLSTFGLGLFIFTLVMGIFALFGAETVAWNEVHYTGVKGLLMSILLGLFLAIWFTFFMWLLGILGMWVNSKRYGLAVTFRQVESLPSTEKDAQTEARREGQKEVQKEPENEELPK